MTTKFNGELKFRTDVVALNWTCLYMISDCMELCQETCLTTAIFKLCNLRHPCSYPRQSVPVRQHYCHFMFIVCDVNDPIRLF